MIDPNDLVASMKKVLWKSYVYGNNKGGFSGSHAATNAKRLGHELMALADTASDSRLDPIASEPDDFASVASAIVGLFYLYGRDDGMK